MRTMVGFPLYALGDFLHSKKKVAAAERAFRRAINIKPNHPLWNARVGAILLHKKAYTEALHFYEKASEFAPDRAPWHFGRGKCLEALGRYAEAAEAFETAAHLKPDPAYYKHFANILRRHGKHWQEVEALRHTTQLNKKDSGAFFQLGEALEVMGGFKDSAAAYRAAISLKKNATWLYRLGYVLEKDGDKKSAEEAYAAATTADPKHPSARFGVGVFHQARNLWAEAAAAYQKRLTQSPMDAELHYRAGYALDRCFRWEDAQQFYLQAIALNPKVPQWHHRLGLAYERCGQYSDAATSYGVAAATQDKHTPYWFFRWAQVLQKMDDWEGAVQAYLQMDPKFRNIESAPASDAKFSETARIEREASYFARVAKNGIARIISTFGSNSPDAKTHFSLGELHAYSSQWDLAAVEHEAAVEREINFNPDWFKTLGYALYKAGKFKEACDAFQETRIPITPHGIDLAPYMDNHARKAVMEYNELLGRPLREKTIVYESFAGDSMSCNPYAIFKRLIDAPEFAGWLHVWVVNKRSSVSEKYLHLQNVVFVPRETDLYRRYLATASHLINNSTFPTWFIRREGQKYLNTWHGTPLKTLGVRMLGRFQEHKNGARNFLQATHLISPNSHTTSVTRDDFGVRGLIEHKIAETGYPRIDLMLRADSAVKSDIRSRIGVSGEKPVLLYAPTWRGTHGSVELDLKKLRHDIEVMRSQNCDVIFRGHSMVQKILSNSDLGVTIAPDDLDTNELLSVVDILVTDYSSIFFDYIPSKRPIIFYAYDLDQYSEERGMYFDMSEMPGKLCRDPEEMRHAIVEAVASLAQEQEYDQKTFNIHDDGLATDRCIDFFFKENAPVAIPDGRKRIIFFAGPFMPNGITASVINLLRSIDPTQYLAYLVIDPAGIERAPERLELFSRLPAHVQIIARSGLMAMTFEERWINDNIEKPGIAPPAGMLTLHNQNMKKEFSRVFGDSNFDSAVNFEGYQRFWAKLLGASSAKRKTIFLHNDMYNEWFTKYPDLRHLFTTYHEYDELLSVSDAMSLRNSESLSRAFDIPASHFAPCPNMIDTDQIFSKSQETLDADFAAWFSPKLVTFVTVGRLSPEKDQAKLIAAFAEVHRKAPHTRLVIVGDGPLKGQLQRLITDLKLTDTVYLAGLRQNALPTIKAASCFVLSSNHEGQPIVLLEAMTLGTPIIATDIVGNRGVLSDGFGLLTPNSKEGLVEGMQTFLAGDLHAKAFDYQGYSKGALERFLSLI